MLKPRHSAGFRRCLDATRLNFSLPFSLHSGDVLLIAAALGAIAGLSFFFHGFSLLQQRWPVPIHRSVKLSRAGFRRRSTCERAYRENGWQCQRRATEHSPRSHQAHAARARRRRFRVYDPAGSHRGCAVEGRSSQSRNLDARIDASHRSSGRSIDKQTHSHNRSRGLARAATRSQRVRLPHPRAESGESTPRFELESNGHDLGRPGASPGLHLHHGRAFGVAVGEQSSVASL